MVWSLANFTVLQIMKNNIQKNVHGLGCAI